MHKVLVWFAFFFMAGYVNVLHGAVSSSDAPEYPRDATVVFKAAGSYDHALQIWKSPEDVNEWIAANFSYDMARALRLSETQKAQHERISIYNPSEFFDTKTGVCVDLSRFGVEALRRIAPNSDPQYLMIEFDPIQLKGNMLRLHWLVSFRRNGKTYFFADSKRPGHMAGPYNNTQEFIREYEQYRGRKIVAFRELESYQKQYKTQALKLQVPKTDVNKE
ncbi:MAG: hypothetical protein NTW71_09820 [Deltaproteobacteria bacterium]|nr:hypothetical protein [Deltaproteobacteria bacterium]